MRLDATEQQALSELVGKLEHDRFPSDQAADPKHARLFAYLAATSQDPKQVAAALAAMRLSYTSSSHNPNRATADADYGRVVAYHLRSSDPQIQGLALEAAPHALGGSEVQQPVVDELVRIAAQHPHAGARADAVQALQLVQGFAEDPRIAGALLDALRDDKAYVVSRSLFALRTWAAELAGRLGQGRADVAGDLLPLLGQPDPYVRSAAVAALSYLGYLPSAHAIAKLLDDKTKNTYVLCCYTSLTSQKISIEHRGSDWPEVRDAAVNALARLSSRTTTIFRPDRVDPAELEASLDRNARAAKAWYAKLRAELPKE